MNTRHPKTILLQTVGTGRKPDPQKPGDPGNPVWEAMAHVVKARRPDRLVLLCSPVSEKQTLPLLRPLLDRLERSPETQVETLDDADNVNSLALEYARLIDRLRQEHPGSRIETDFTSGTKAMSAALVAAAVGRRVGQLHYAVGERDGGGRAFRTDRVVSLSTSPLVADRLLLELGRLYELGQYEAVRLQAGRLVDERFLDAAAQDRARSLLLVAAAADAWDRFDWAAAFEHLYTAISDASLASAAWDIDAMREKKKFVGLCRKPFTHQRLTDLLTNAQRCMTRGRYDDAVARLYRLLECLLQARFCKAYPAGDQANPTAKVELAWLRKAAPLAADELGRKAGRRTRMPLGIADTARVLAELQDPIARHMLGLPDSAPPGPDRLKPLLETRNASWLAHGSRPVTSQACSRMFDCARAGLELHLGSADALTDLVEQARFPQCPWATTDPAIPRSISGTAAVGI